MKLLSKKNFASFVAVAVIALSAVTAVALPTSSVLAADCDVSSGIDGGVNCATGGDDSTLFGDGGVFNTVVNVMLFIVGALSVIMLIYGGIRYTISAGDQGAVTNAKNTIMYSIIGLVVSMLAFAIVNWVINIEL